MTNKGCIVSTAANETRENHSVKFKVKDADEQQSATALSDIVHVVSLLRDFGNTASVKAVSGPYKVLGFLIHLLCNSP